MMRGAASGGRDKKPRIEVTINTNGTIEFEQKGYDGPSCVDDVVAQLIKNHSDVVEDRVTSEYRNPRPAVNVTYAGR